MHNIPQSRNSVSGFEHFDNAHDTYPPDSFHPDTKALSPCRSHGHRNFDTHRRGSRSSLHTYGTNLAHLSVVLQVRDHTSNCFCQPPFPDVFSRLGSSSTDPRNQSQHHLLTRYQQPIAISMASEQTDEYTRYWRTADEVESFQQYDLIWRDRKEGLAEVCARHQTREYGVRAQSTSTTFQWRELAFAIAARVTRLTEVKQVAVTHIKPYLKDRCLR